MKSIRIYMADRIWEDAAHLARVPDDRQAAIREAVHLRLTYLQQAQRQGQRPGATLPAGFLSREQQDLGEPARGRRINLPEDDAAELERFSRYLAQSASKIVHDALVAAIALDRRNHPSKWNKLDHQRRRAQPTTL